MKLIVLLLNVLILFPCYSQDLQVMEWVTKSDFTYEIYNEFSDGMVKIGDQNENDTLQIIKYGYADTEGNVIIVPEYIAADKFSEGLACVKKEDKTGYIDKTGKSIVPFKFDTGKEFSSDRAIVVKNGRAEVINRKGKKQFDFKDFTYLKRAHIKDDLIRTTRNGKYGFINLDGEVIIDFRYEGASDFSEGLAAVKKDGFWTYIDKEGKTPFTHKPFTKAKSFKSGIALVGVGGIPVSRGPRSSKDSYPEEMFIDKKGRSITDKSLHSSNDFSSDGIVNVYLESRNDMKSDSRQVLMNKKGEILGDVKLHNHYNLCSCTCYCETGISEGVGVTKSSNGYTYINDKVDYIYNLNFKKAFRFKDGLAGVKAAGRNGIIKHPSKLEELSQVQIEVVPSKFIKGYPDALLSYYTTGKREVKTMKSKDSLVTIRFHNYDLLHNKAPFKSLLINGKRVPSDEVLGYRDRDSTVYIMTKIGSGQNDILFEFGEYLTAGISIESTPLTEDGKVYLGVDEKDIEKEFLSFKHPDWELEKVLNISYKKKLSDNLSSAYIRDSGKSVLLNEKGEVLAMIMGKIEMHNKKAIIVKHENTFRFLNSKGEFTTEHTYDNIDDFRSSKLIKVSSNGMWGALDEFGNEVIPLQRFYPPKPMRRIDNNSRYSYRRMSLDIDDVIKPFSESIRNGEPMPEHFIFCTPEGVGIKNTSDEIVIPAEYLWIKPPSEGMVSVSKGEKYGFVNMNNELVIDYQFTRFSSFRDGVAEVTISDMMDRNTKMTYGFIDKTGNLVIDYKYENSQVGEFNNGIATFKINDLIGLIDTNGKVVAEPIFTKVADFNKIGLAAVNIGDKKGYINTNGEIIIPIEYSRISPIYNFTKEEQIKYLTSKKYSNSNRGTITAFILEKNALKGVCDINGKIIIPLTQEYISGNRASSYIQIKNGNKSYCLDKNYAKVVQEDVYDGLECTKGIGKLSVNGKKLSFFYPEDGKSIEKTYDRINYLKSGFYVVSKDGKQAVLNTEYQEVLPFSEQRYYSIIPPNFLIVPSSENTMAVGLEDFKGNELLPRIFERITIENEDYFSVSSRKQIAYFKRKR